MAATSTDYGFPGTTIVVGARGILGIVGGWILGAELHSSWLKRR